MLVEALIAQSAVEALDVTILRGLPRLDEIKDEAVSLCALAQDSRDEFGAVVDRDRLRSATLLD